MKTVAFLAVLTVAVFLILGDSPLSANPGQVMDVKKELPKQPDTPIKMTEAEWKEKLSPEQFKILRKAGTERAHGAVYEQFKKQGDGSYCCVGCGAELFSSKTKFDSGSGWPSFYDVAKNENVTLDTDYHLGYARTEVRCSKCDGHLGHVFEGEPFASMGGKKTPTGKRYCINGTVLDFVPSTAIEEE